MTTYTTPYSLPIIEPSVDLIKDGATASALADAINRLSNATNAAVAAGVVAASPFKGDLPSGADMNTMKTPQEFTISQGTLWASIANLPPDLPQSAGWGSVRNTANGLTEQVVSTYGADAQEWWRVTVNAGTGAFGPWRRRDVDKITSPYSGLANSVRLSEFITKIGGTKFTNGLGAVAIRYDHGLANLKTKIQPLHAARNISFLVAINSRNWGLAENAGCSIADVQSWITAGLASLGNHGAHHNDASTTAALTDTIVGGLTELQGQFPTAYIPGFVVPGVGGTNYNGFNSGTTPENFYNTTAGRLILENHAISTGAFPGTGRRVLDGKVRQGQAHYSMEAQTYASIKAQIDAAKTEKTGLQLFMHPSLLDTPGYLTTATLTQVLDYIKAERDAGRLAVMTPYELLLADSGAATNTAVEAKNASQDAAIAAARWASPTSLASTVSFDSPLPFGQTSTASAANPGLPAAVIGSAVSEKVSAASLLTYKTWGTDPRLFMRGFAVNGAPYPWKEFAGVPALTAVANRVSVLESSQNAQRNLAGMKVVPLTMTAPGTPLSTTTDQGSVRWVRRYAVMPKRVRIHVANRNTGNALNGNADLKLSQIRVGVGDAAGGYTGGIIALSGGTIAADGSERITPWITVPGLVDGGYINITVGWWGGLGTATLQHNQGGGWTTTDDANGGEADTMTSGAWTRSQTTPLHCWIEAEVPASTPVVMGNGDSITAGTATADPVGDSWTSQYAYNMGALPVILAMHGSTMANWTPGAPRWAQYGSFDLKGVVDAVVTTLGQNDLAAAGMDLATLQSRHTTFMAALRGAFPSQPIYLGTITPSNKAADLEQLRRDFNAWRAESGQRERGVLDFATAIGGVADEDLLPEYSADGLHPNAAGQAAMAAVVEALPVTPFTLSPAKLKALY